MKALLSDSIPINLIRQWCYCPRVVFYQELLTMAVKRPRWVQQGSDFHQHEEKLWRRRDLSRFNLESGERYHNLSLASKKLGLHGIADMGIETEDQVFAIEFKLTAHAQKRGDVLQLTAYAMLMEEHFKKTAKVGIIVGKGKKLYKISMTNTLREAVIDTAHKIRQMLLRGLKPESDATVTQCCNCEYLNHCNDRL